MKLEIIFFSCVDNKHRYITHKMTLSHKLGYTGQLADEEAKDNIGVAGTNLTAKEEQLGSFHKTTLLVGSLGLSIAVAGNASEAVGHQIYTFPAGKKCAIKSVYLSLNVSSGQADTPEIGVGTVIGSGPVAVLGTPATFENGMEGAAIGALNGAGGVNVERTVSASGSGDQDSGNVFLNFADGWAAAQTISIAAHDDSNDGIIVIEWTVLA